jgi:general secretion pathway protein E
MAVARRQLAEILVDSYGLTTEQVRAGIEAAQRNDMRLGSALLAQSAIDEMTLARALSDQLGLPVMESLSVDDLDLELIEELPISFAKNHGILPVRRRADGVVDVVVTDPMNISPVDDLRAFLGAPVQVWLGGVETVLAAINAGYDKVAATAGEVMGELEDAETGQEDNVQEIVDILDATDDEAPIIRFVNTLFTEALKERASDIHIEPFERELVVRFRIDGVLYDKFHPPKRAQTSIVSRVKVMATLDIAEKRLPQDGRIRIKVAGRDVDIRTSTVPVAHGERVVMRLQDRSAGLLGLSEVGIKGEQFEGWNKLIRRPHGILLVTGPTGSGKTTTLYASITVINAPDINILTVEDPIEYQIQGIGQMAVNPKINLTFAGGLRAYLRQDPDVILVGEIRDHETAEIAIQASLTGHLVLSTLHTNDAAGAVTRLVDMGVEPFLVSSSLIGIMAQRLVRRVCPTCREPFEPTAEQLAEIGLPPTALAGNTVYSARTGGCEECLGTGYRGRTGIYELLEVDEAMRQLIVTTPTAGAVKKEAMRRGMITLRDDGAAKVLQGLTTMEEVLRVTQEEAVELLG